MTYFLGSSLISWEIKKQNSVALSTIKSEYVTIASCCDKLLWIKKQLKDFESVSKYVPLLCDNTSALKRAKYINVRHLFL